MPKAAPDLPVFVQGRNILRSKPWVCPAAPLENQEYGQPYSLLLQRRAYGLYSTSKTDAGHGLVQAPLLAHTMLHHPRAWPNHEAALGLLISLRKYLQTQLVRIFSALYTYWRRAVQGV